MDGVYDCYNKLAETADDQTNCQEKSAASNASDDCNVDQDGYYAEGSENAAILESVADICHLEEVSTVS